MFAGDVSRFFCVARGTSTRLYHLTFPRLTFLSVKLIQDLAILSEFTVVLTLTVWLHQLQEQASFEYYQSNSTIDHINRQFEILESSTPLLLLLRQCWMLIISGSSFDFTATSNREVASHRSSPQLRQSTSTSRTINYLKSQARTHKPENDTRRFFFHSSQPPTNLHPPPMHGILHPQSRAQHHHLAQAPNRRHRNRAHSIYLPSPPPRRRRSHHHRRLGAGMGSRRLGHIHRCHAAILLIIF